MTRISNTVLVATALLWIFAIGANATLFRGHHAPPTPTTPPLRTSPAVPPTLHTAVSVSGFDTDITEDAEIGKQVRVEFFWSYVCTVCMYVCMCMCVCVCMHG